MNTTLDTAIREALEAPPLPKEPSSSSEGGSEEEDPKFDEFNDTEESEESEEDLSPEERVLLAEKKEQEAKEAENRKALALDPEDLTRFAKAMGVDEEDLVIQDGTLRVRTKINGEVGQVSLKDLKKSYQIESSLTRKQEAFAREQEEKRQAIEQQATQTAQVAQTLQQMAQADLDQLQQRYNSPELAALRENDPAEYSATIADLQRQGQLIQARWSQANQALQQQQYQQQQKVQAWQQQTVLQEKARLWEKLGWQDEATASEGGQKIESYLTSSGFSPEELAGFVDHRAAVIADKARRYDELMLKVENTRAKVKKAPDPVKAPGGASRVGQKPDLRGLRAKARASKDPGSAAGLAYLLAGSKR